MRGLFDSFVNVLGVALIPAVLVLPVSAANAAGSEAPISHIGGLAAAREAPISHIGGNAAGREAPISPIGGNAAGPLRILALGDSLTQGYGLAAGWDFPAQLEDALRARGHDVIVINAGVSGDTSAGGLARLDWSLAGDFDSGPDAAIVEFGGNDALRGLPPQETQSNLDAMLAKLGERNIPVLLAGMKSPRNMGPEYATEFDAVFPRLAEKYDVLFYPFFLDGVVLAPALMQDDGIHANEQGMAEIVARIVPLAEELIARARGAAP